MSNRKIHWKTFNKLRINDALLKKESKQLLLQYKERNDKENHIDCILSLRLKQLTNQPYKIGYNSICWNIDNSIHSKKDHGVFDSLSIMPYRQILRDSWFISTLVSAGRVERLSAKPGNSKQNKFEYKFS